MCSCLHFIMFTPTILPNTDFHHKMSHYSEENILVVLVPTIMADKIQFVVTYDILIFISKNITECDISNQTRTL